MFLKKCYPCGTHAISDARFCPSCQSILATACPNCGNDLSGDELNCFFCGSDLSQHRIRWQNSDPPGSIYDTPQKEITRLFELGYADSATQNLCQLTESGDVELSSERISEYRAWPSDPHQYSGALKGNEDKYINAPPGLGYMKRAMFEAGKNIRTGSEVCISEYFYNVAPQKFFQADTPDTKYGGEFRITYRWVDYQTSAETESFWHCDLCVNEDSGALSIKPMPKPDYINGNLIRHPDLLKDDYLAGVEEYLSSQNAPDDNRKRISAIQAKKKQEFWEQVWGSSPLWVPFFLLCGAGLYLAGLKGLPLAILAYIGLLVVIFR